MVGAVKVPVPALMTASNVALVSAVMVCASMSSLVTLIVAPGLTVSVPWYLKPLISISAPAAAGEELGLEVEVTGPVMGADDAACSAAVGAAVVPDADMPEVPQPERASMTVVTVSPRALSVLVFAFMVKPFVCAAVVICGVRLSVVFDPAGQDGGGELVGEGVPGDALRSQGCWQVGGINLENEVVLLEHG